VYRGFAISVLLHAALLAWAVISIQAMPEIVAPETPTIEASIVTLSELTRLKKGSPDSKVLEAKAKEEPKPEVSKTEAEKPKPVTAPEPAAATPPPTPDEPKPAEPPPEPKKAEPAPPPEEKVAALPAATPEPAPGPTPEELKKQEDERRAEEARKAEEQRQAEERKKEEERKKAEEKKKKEDERKKKLAEQKKLAEAKRKAEEAKKSKFDPDRISALLDKTPDKRGAPRSAQPPTSETDYAGPTAGEREGHDTVLTAREADLLKGQISAQIKNCWKLPGGGGGIETAVVTLKWRLKPDGALDGDPVPLERQADALQQRAQEAAIRAVICAAPFDLPPDKYTAWRTIEWTFNPRDML